MPLVHHHPVDQIEDLRCEFGYVIYYCLQTIALLLIKQPVPQHLTQGVMLIGQFHHPIIVTVQSQAHNAQHQYRPQTHAGATRIRIDLLQYVFFQ